MIMPVSSMTIPSMPARAFKELAASHSKTNMHLMRIMVTAPS
jgi:CRP-like cAMP-binding protein